MCLCRYACVHVDVYICVHVSMHAYVCVLECPVANFDGNCRSLNTRNLL